MSNTNDGGPAFPHPINKHEVGMQYAIVDGMSLRDWFAGQALAGLMAKPIAPSDFGQGSHAWAAAAYAYADAMLAARGAKT